MIRRRIETGALLALLVAGCAPLPPTPTSAPAPPARAAGTVIGGSGASVGARRTIVPADSTPSGAALEVLATIPEPLTPGERVPPRRATEPEALGSDSVARAPDGTSPDAAALDTAVANVPVPEPTLPLGERRRVTADSSGTSAAAPPAGAPSVPSSPAGGAQPHAPAAGVAAPDTCWRVQVLAPLDSDQAEQASVTASSLLLVPMVVEREQGRYKVRTKGCMSRAAADQLRRRAVESGFPKAFRVSGVKP